MKTILVCLELLVSCSAPLAAQLVPAPVDLFEHAQWGMPIARLRALSNDASLEIMRSVRTNEVVEKNGQVFFIRKEAAFGEQLRVMYVIRAQDSTLRRLIINVLELTGLPGKTRGTYDTVWKRIERRYGSSVPADGASRARRYWTTPTSTIEAFRFEGPASGVTLIARPLNEPP